MVHCSMRALLLHRLMRCPERQASADLTSAYWPQTRHRPAPHPHMCVLGCLERPCLSAAGFPWCLMSTCSLSLPPSLPADVRARMLGAAGRGRVGGVPRHRKEVQRPQVRLLGGLRVPPAVPCRLACGCIILLPRCSLCVIAFHLRLACRPAASHCWQDDPGCSRRALPSRPLNPAGC